MFNLTKVNATDTNFIDFKRYLFSTQYNLNKSGSHPLWGIVNRYDVEMNNCYVDNSPVHRFGVFATHDMCAGDIITLYPADLVVETVDKQTNEYNLLVSKELYDLKFSNDEFTKETVIEKCSDFFYNYVISLTENINISGSPDLDINLSYVGHLINDGTEIIPTDEIMIDKYNNSSQLRANCCFKNFNNVLVAIAMKDIKKDDEIFLNYGHKYWLSDRTKKIE